MTLTNKVKFYLIKILNRFKLLDYINLTTSIHFLDKSYIIPVNGGIGLEHLYTFDDYDYSVYHFFKSEISSGDFLDVGANTGQTIIKINTIHADTRIISVEPNPNCIAYLTQLKAVNSLDNVQIIPAALFDAPGLQKLYSISAADTSASLVSDNRPGFFEKSKFTLVNAVDGSQLFQVLSKNITFIKIDVEGAELHVLKSIKELVNKYQPSIYCEVLDAHSKEVLESNTTLKKEIWQFVTEHLDYKIYQFDSRVSNLVRLEKFPERIYSSNNLDQCNYIFKR